jgi:hypothetical protein
MGAEFRGKGVHVALGPMMNLMRAPAAGRNWEGYVQIGLTKSTQLNCVLDSVEIHICQVWLHFTVESN